MSKRLENKNAPPPSSGFLGKATLTAACLVLLANISLWTQNKEFQASLTERLNKIDTQMGQLSGKIDNVARNSAAPRGGVDPNKIYTVKTEGSPFEGPSTAPVTIAEFSDFQ